MIDKITLWNPKIKKSSIWKSSLTILMTIPTYFIYIAYKIVFILGADTSSPTREIMIWKEN